jgi:hypothetical protein
MALHRRDTCATKYYFYDGNLILVIATCQHFCDCNLVSDGDEVYRGAGIQRPATGAAGPAGAGEDWVVAGGPGGGGFGAS